MANQLSPEAYAHMRTNPRFARAVRRFASNMLAAADSDPSLDGLLKDAGRKVAALCAVYLNATGGLTLPRLKSLIAGFGLVSPGRARALLIYLRYLGYVEVWPRAVRGKPDRFELTQRFLSHYRRHLSDVADALVEFDPAWAALRDGMDDPGVFEAFVVELGDQFLDGTRRGHDQDAYYRAFMHKNAGTQVIYTLLLEAEDDVFPPKRPIGFQVAAAADRFKVSRTHIRRILDAARTGGLVILGDGEVTFTEAGREAVEWIFATQMILYLGSAARTLARVKAVTAE
jgi:hypothetical protein